MIYQIRLFFVGRVSLIEFSTTDKQAKQLFHMLILDHGAIVKISLYNGGMWLRLSANVYNRPEDYDFICAKLKELFYTE